MNHIRWVAAIFLLLGSTSGTLAADKDDVKAAIDKATQAFNSKDYPTYFSSFTDNLQVYTTIETPLLYETKSSWESFINGLAAFPVVTYSQQNNSYEVYNSNTATVTGYYIFKVVSNDGMASNQSGRASTFLVKLNGKWLIANMHFSKLF